MNIQNYTEPLQNFPISQISNWSGTVFWGDSVLQEVEDDSLHIEFEVSYKKSGKNYIGKIRYMKETCT